RPVTRLVNRLSNDGRIERMSSAGDVYTMCFGSSRPRRSQLLYDIVRYTGWLNCRPDGSNTTWFTAPTGATAEMLTVLSSAPDGIVSVYPLTVIEPPAVPIACTLESYAWGVQLSRLSPSRIPFPWPPGNRCA